MGWTYKKKKYRQLRAHLGSTVYQQYWSKSRKVGEWVIDLVWTLDTGDQASKMRSKGTKKYIKKERRGAIQVSVIMD